VYSLGKELNFSVVDNMNGTYTVSYVVIDMKKSDFSVTVSLRGCPIRGSPFRVALFSGYKGDFFREWGAEGKEQGEFDSPCGMDVYGGEIYVTDQCNNRIQVFTTGGDFVRA